MDTNQVIGTVVAGAVAIKGMEMINKSGKQTRRKKGKKQKGLLL